MTGSRPSFAELADAVERLDALRESATRVLAREWSADRTRALLDEPVPAWPDDLWSKLVALGWRDLLVAEDAGGGSATIAELAAIAEIVGASTAATPVVSAAVAQWCLGEIEPGDRLTILHLDGALSLSRDDRDRTVLHGRLDLVPFADVADRLVATARSDDGAATLVVVDLASEAVARSSEQPLDHSPTATVEVSPLAVPAVEVVAAGDAASVRISAARRRLVVGLTAELAGVAAAANERAADYAKVRVAFDRPIGAFQAIKHRLVDQRADIEVARALISSAADAVERDATDADARTSLAAFWAIDTLRAVTEGCVQVFGGVGYTWEHDAHLALRRAAVLSARLGDMRSHREIVRRWIESGGTSR